MKKITPQDLRIFDNGGKTLDRYTILPPKWAWRHYKGSDGFWNCIGSSEFGGGFFMWVTVGVPGRYLGKRVTFDSLSPELQVRLKHAFDIDKIERLSEPF